MSGNVTAVYDKIGGLGMFQKTMQNFDDVKVTLLYSYPARADALWMSVVDVLTEGNLFTLSGKRILLSKVI